MHSTGFRNRPTSVRARAATGLVLVGLMAGGTVACSDDPKAAAPTTTVATTPTTEPTTSSSTTVAPTTTAAPAGNGTVNLTFTGTLVFTAKGQGGRCDNTAHAFSFTMTKGDFPAAGESFVLTADTATDGAIRWDFGGDRRWASSGSHASLIFSSDMRSVTIADDLVPQATASGATPGPVHVSGTIACP